MRVPQKRDDVKSDEEFAMVLWLQEATRHNLVRFWGYEPTQIVLVEPENYIDTKQLKTKVKMVEKSLHRGATYTPDFEIILTALGHNLLSKFFAKALLGSPEMEPSKIYIDVKGTFNPHQKDPRYFSLVQKVAHCRHGVWVQKVIPYTTKKKSGLFNSTYAPDSLRWMTSRKAPTLNAVGRACCDVTEYLAKTDYRH